MELQEERVGDACVVTAKGMLGIDCGRAHGLAALGG